MDNTVYGRHRKGQKFSCDQAKHSYTPVSLFTICVNFVAFHLDLVESFDGFPEIVAKEIFESAEKQGKFKLSCKEAIHLMHMFTNEYEDLILKSLNVSRCHLGLNFALGNFQLFNHLSELDVSSCALGDNHEFLSNIGHMTRLLKLDLSDNCLSDKGLQKVSAPHRVFGRGPLNLHVLDLSDNSEVTSRGILSFSSFSGLQTVDVTATKVKHDKKLEKYWKFKPAKINKKIDIQTSGWAENVVLDWVKFAEQKANTPSQIRSKTTQFYSKTTKDKVTIKNQPIKSVRGFRLLLQRTNDVAAENNAAHVPIKTDGDVEKPLCTARQKCFGSMERDFITSYMYLQPLQEEKFSVTSENYPDTTSIDILEPCRKKLKSDGTHFHARNIKTSILDMPKESSLKRKLGKKYF